MAKAGDVIGRYVLERELGKGAAGAVFLAHDTLLDVPVCIKLLHEALATDAATLARFKRELLIARRVAHPGVCRVFDLGEEGEVRFLVMEYIQGEDLAKLLNRERRLEVSRAVSLLRQVCQALGAAHKEGVVHRDLKPGNVILRPDGRATLVDFGIATATDLDRLTRPGIVMGSRSYMAPEVWKGAPATPASDVWAVGVILYGCVTGRLPYKGDGLVGVLDAIQNTTPTPPSVHNPAVPPALEAVIQRAMRLDPKERYADGQAMDAALAELEQGLPALPSAGARPAPAAAGSESGGPAPSEPSEEAFAARTDDATLYPQDRVPAAPDAAPPAGAPSGEAPAGAASAAPRDAAAADRAPGDDAPGDDAPMDDALTREVERTRIDLVPPGAGEEPALQGPDEPTRRVAFSDVEALDDLERAFRELPTRPVAVHEATRTEYVRGTRNGRDTRTDLGRERSRPPLGRYAAVALGGVALFVVGGLLALSGGGEGAPPAPEETPPVEPEEAKPAAARGTLPGHRAPGDRVPAEDAPAEREDAEEAPGDDAPAGEAPAGEAPPDDAPADDAPADDAPADDAPADDAPADDAPLAPRTPSKAVERSSDPLDDEPRLEAPGKQAAAERAGRASRAPAEKRRYASRRRALDGAVQARGLLWGDVPRLDAQRRKMYAAARAGRYGEAVELALAAKSLVEETPIDRRFVEQKLARFNRQYDKSRDPGLKKQLSTVFLDVTKALSRDDHRGANAALNRGFSLLGEAR